MRAPTPEVPERTDTPPQPTDQTDLDAAHAKRGSTIFDWLVEIFEEEVPGRLLLC